MRLQKKSVWAIVFITSGALLGLVALQAFLLKNAIRQKEQSFAQNVNAALASVVRKLETRETLSDVMDLTVNVDEEVEQRRGHLRLTAIGDSTAVEDSTRISMRKATWDPNIRFDDGKVMFFLPSPQHVRIFLMDSLGNVIENVLDDTRSAGKHAVDLGQANLKEGNFRVTFKSDSISYVMNLWRGSPKQSFRFPSKASERKILVARVVDQLADANRKPISERLAGVRLDSLVTATFAEHGVATPYAYGVLSSEHPDSVMMASRPELAAEIAASEFRAALFPYDILVEPNELAVYFPHQSLHLFKQVAFPVVVSLIFVVILAGSFAYVIRVLFAQRQFATRLTNFINNMTHEFKTPISTVSLATESLSQAAIRDNPRKFERYRRIIENENLRMRQQVEKILQMAVLEENDFELEISTVDVHALITKAIENVTPQLEKFEGAIETRLAASPSELEVDAVHFANIVHSLLDNAIKYRRGKPEITVATETRDGGLVIRVADNGVGIAPEEQQYVFDKYYRVPTGNVHDVKGFGLGLSYVKLIVESHNGRVSLQSEPNRGSVFEVFLPFVQSKT